MLASIYEMVRKLRHDEEGATAIEYGLIAALLAVAIVGVLGTVAGDLTGTFNSVSTALKGG